MSKCAFKLVPFQFNYNIENVEEVIKLLKWKEIDYTSVSGKKIIWNITWNELLWDKIFISLEANYENNLQKNVIWNESRKKEWEVKEWQTVTNDIIIFLDFWVREEFEKFTDNDKNSKGIMFVIYNWNYSVIKNVLSFFEEKVFENKILNISNFHDSNQFLHNVKKFISWIKTDVMYSTENKKWKITKKKIWEFILTNNYVASEEKWIIKSMEELIDGSMSFFKELPVKIESIPSVIIKWKKRSLVKDEKTKNYIIKNFPQEQEISDNWEKQTLDIIKNIKSWKNPYDNIVKLSHGLEVIKQKIFQ